MASVDPPARKGLPPEAYEVVPGSEYRPYVPASESMAEFTVKAVVVGILLAVVFGAANAYLGLRVGLTVSASIPAAVMAVAIFQLLRRGTILETNMVQTIGSAGESVAAGVIFTIPALFIWQRSDPTIVVDLLQVSVIAGFGGLLGVLFMIPLRRYLISREHGKLPYPVSGMTIAALLLTSLIWVALGLNDGGAAAKVAVLAVGAVVCISAAAAGDTSQDLKTGFLVGATPKRMQVGEMLGVLACAVTIGFVLIVLNESYGIGTVDGLAAPQATLMSLVIDGVLNASLPWTFVFIGIGLALVVEFVFKLPSLAFAVGVYLPVSLMTPILVGGLMRRALTRRYEDAGETEDGVSVLAEKREQGVLYASGLIAGAALVGVLIGGLIYAVTYFTGDPGTASVWQVGHAWMDDLPWLNAVSWLSWVPDVASIVGILAFTGLCWMLWRAATRRSLS